MEEADYQIKSSQFISLRIYTTTVFLFLYVIYGANKHLIKLDIIYLGTLIAAIINLSFIFYLLYLNSTLRDSNYNKNLMRIIVAIGINVLLVFIAYYGYY